MQRIAFKRKRATVSDNRWQGDMTEGNPFSLMIRFALPLFIGNLFQLFYNLVDSIVVGNYVGKSALAAVGACATPSYLFVSLSLGFATGLGILVAQFYGAKDHRNVQLVISNAMVILGTIASALSLLGLVASPALLQLLGTPQDIMADAVVYMRVTCLGVIATAFYNGLSMILRALGDSRTPLFFLIASSILHIVLDLVFVIYFHMEVLGVALSTVISQAISAIALFLYVFRRNEYFYFSKSTFRIDKKIIIKSLRLGIPLALQSSVVTISVLVVQGYVNSFGDTVIAANTVTKRVDDFAMTFFNALGSALSIFAGQNMGAGKIDRVKSAHWKMLFSAFAVCFVLIPLVCIFGGEITRLFVKEQDVIDIGHRGLIISAPCYIGLSITLITRAFLNGCGDTVFSLINAFTEIACRVVYTLILMSIPAVGCWGVWYTTGATWVTNAVVCLIRYFSGKWKAKGVVTSA